MSYMIVTSKGVRVSDAQNKGIKDKEQAQSDADRRNRAAENIGIDTRYEVKTFKNNPKSGDK